jgi:type III restriction enzyme
MATNGKKMKLAVKDSQTLQRRQKRYTLYTLVEEISRYTHLCCLKVEKILRNSDMGIEGCLAWVNRENRLIEVIVRCILDAVFRYEVVNEVEWEEVELAKNFPMNWVVEEDKRALEMYDGRYPNSFHIEPYIFNNESEKRLFEYFVEHKEIEEIYYTGGITDVGHNEFYVEYYDELEGRWRRYYPDFILKLKNNGWAVVEVKQADQTAHPNVVAKEQAARELFEKLNSIRYIVKRDDEIRRGMLQDILQTLS